MELFLIVLISYLMGSIPFGLILTKIFLNKDIREIGSGNIGATNVLRTGNKINWLYNINTRYTKSSYSNFIYQNKLSRFNLCFFTISFFRTCIFHLVKV